MAFKRKIQIAIDGPAGAGKSTVSREVARKLGLDYLDTGAMYRAITLKIIRSQIDLEDQAELEKLLEQTRLEIANGENGSIIYLDGEDVTTEIRKSHVNQKVSEVACVSLIRKKMVAMQKDIASRSRGIVVEGRDICSRVLPEATYKFYLEASLTQRVWRRWKEQLAKGMDIPMAQVEQEIIKRDSIDSQRADSPLMVAPGVTVIDTTELSLEEVVDSVLGAVAGGEAAVEGK